jgi:MFS transporter, DHA1 family, multidrug resistance protein
MTPQQQRPARALLILCTVGFAGFFASYLRIPVLPLLAAALGGSPGQVGIINAAFMLSAGLLSIPAGVLADRVGRRPMLLGGISLLSVSSFLIAGATSPLQMAAIYLLFGAGLAAFAPTMMSLVADASPPSLLGRTFAWYTTAVYAAMTFGPAVGGFLAKAAGLKPVFLISGGVLFLLCAAVFIVIPREPSCHHPPPMRHLPAAIRQLLGNRQFFASLLVTLGGCFSFGIFVTFLPLYARSHGLDPGQIGLVFSAQAVVNVVSRIPFGRLGDNAVNRGPLAAAGFFLIATAVAVIGLCATALSFAACGALLGTGMAIGFTAVTAIIVATVPREARGLAMGLYNSCIFLGMMVGSAVMGGVIHAVGYRAGFLGGGGVCAALTFVFVALYRRGEGGGASGAVEE